MYVMFRSRIGKRKQNYEADKKKQKRRRRGIWEVGGEGNARVGLWFHARQERAAGEVRCLSHWKPGRRNGASLQYGTFSRYRHSHTLLPAPASAPYWLF